MRFYKKTTIFRGNDNPYLIRHSIFSCSLFAIKIHQILESDDACLHNHPWAFLTILLKGGYFEESFYNGKSDFKYHGRGSILYRPAKKTNTAKSLRNEVLWTNYNPVKKLYLFA